MGQRKLGHHTKAVVYKNVSQQRTKKGTNCCLVLSPLVLCGILFGLQLAINYLFLDRPEFKVCALVLRRSSFLRSSLTLRSSFSSLPSS